MGGEFKQYILRTSRNMLLFVVEETHSGKSDREVGLPNIQEDVGESFVVQQHRP